MAHLQFHWLTSRSIGSPPGPLAHLQVHWLTSGPLAHLQVHWLTSRSIDSPPGPLAHLQVHWLTSRSIGSMFSWRVGMSPGVAVVALLPVLAVTDGLHPEIIRTIRESREYWNSKEAYAASPLVVTSALTKKYINCTRIGKICPRLSNMFCSFIEIWQPCGHYCHFKTITTPERYTHYPTCRTWPMACMAALYPAKLIWSKDIISYTLPLTSQRLSSSHPADFFEYLFMGSAPTLW